MLSISLIILIDGVYATVIGSDSSSVYDAVINYQTTILNPSGESDFADIYYPQKASSLPIALLLQGAFVDKANYSEFAKIVASYGFAVVVPNHFRALDSSSRELFPEQQQVSTVWEYMVAENNDPVSPVNGLLDPDTLVLLGHSFGGAVGLAAITGECVAFLCTDSYERPVALMGGVFYGAPFFNPDTSQGFLPIPNEHIPIGMIAGSLDSATPLDLIQATYTEIQNPPKALITVLGANHYGITNKDNLAREISRPTLKQTIAIETIARWSALFLKATVMGEERAFNYVFKEGDELDKNVLVVNETELGAGQFCEPISTLR
jgi:dienelactone hydrolase